MTYGGESLVVDFGPLFQEIRAYCRGCSKLNLERVTCMAFTEPYPLWGHDRCWARQGAVEAPLEPHQLVGLAQVYYEETEGKRVAGGGKNDNAGKSKDKRLVWQRYNFQG